jgi:hypothetical protein
MTERLRQLHFQSMLQLGKEIDASYDNGSDMISRFQRRRSELLVDFLKEYEPALDDKLQSVVEDPVESIAWIHRFRSPYAVNSKSRSKKKGFMLNGLVGPSGEA